MSQVIAAMLSPAMGVAVSPFPIGGLILLMLGKKGRIDSVFFTIGWMLGNGLVYTIALLAMDRIVTVTNKSAQVMTVAHLLIAVLLFALAFRSLRKIPKAGQQAAAPKWLEKIEDMGPIGSFGIAIMLSALNPLDMALSMNAGVSVAQLSLTTAQYAWSILAFILIASCTVIATAAVFLVAGRHMEASLHRLYHWLLQHGELIIAVLFFVLAVESITKALSP